MRVLSIAHHRNGVSGEPFYVLRFVDSGGPEILLAFVFDTPGHVAVVCENLLPDVAFGSNSWAGDHFEPALRRAIEDWEASPFLVPFKE